MTTNSAPNVILLRAGGVTVCCLIFAMFACGGASGPTPPTEPPPARPEEPLPPPTPPPPVNVVYYKADAESGGMSDWSLPWGVVSSPGSPLPTVSSVRAKSGRYSYLYEAVPDVIQRDVGHHVLTMVDGPRVSMGSPNGGFASGWYSMWVYVDAGYTTSQAWNMLLGWMTGVPGAPSPISHIGLEVRSGELQVVYVLKNCSVGLYPCPDIDGYRNTGGWYTMTSESPLGVRPFPRQRWVHLSIYYLMAPTNGKVEIWQDGYRIMDLTAPTMNTFGGHSSNLTNDSGDMLVQVGIYGGPQAGIQRLYLDDFQVTDERVGP